MRMCGVVVLMQSMRVVRTSRLMTALVNSVGTTTTQDAMTLEKSGRVETMKWAMIGLLQG